MAIETQGFDSVSSKDFHATVGLHLDRARQKPLKIKRYNRDYLVIMNADDFARLAEGATLAKPMSAHRAKTIFG